MGGSTLESWTPYRAVREVDAPETKQWVAEQEKYLSEYDPQKDLEERIQKKKAWIEMRTKMGRPPRPVNQILPSDLRPPKVKAGNLYGGRIVLAFQLKGPLGTNPEGPIVGFAIAGEDGQFQPANAEFPVTSTDNNGKDPINTIDKLERNESGELKKALKAADLKRRLHEARALLNQHEDSQ